MSDALAKTMAVIVGLLLFSVVAVLVLTSGPPVGAQQVTAEFRNAFPLLRGMHVRVDGAIAGSVAEIGVNEEGLAEVTMALDDSIEAPRANASAAIRQQDTTGDSYVSYDPGTAKEPLPERDGRPTIVCGSAGPLEPCANTLAAPRFDDLLNAFGPRERTGVQLLLTELSNAVEERGTDINKAALELRPALVATRVALGEVNKQNAALRSVITDAEAVTGQAASRRRELARLIDSLDSTLQVTASKAPALDAGLARLPATVDETHSTLVALTSAAEAGRPLAQEVGSGAPQLAEALREAPDFLDDAESFVDDTRPTLALTKKLTKKAGPTIAADPDRVVTGPFDLGPALSNLLTGVLGDEFTFQALFGDDSGGQGSGTLGNSGLGAVSVEPGNQIGYPSGFKDRNFGRVTAVINCTVFGQPNKPGCLADALSTARAAASGGGGKDGKRKPAHKRDDAPVNDYRGPDRASGAGGTGPGDSPQVKAPTEKLGDLFDGVKGGLDKGREALRRVSEKLKNGTDKLRQGLPDTGEPLKRLLDFLLR